MGHARTHTHTHRATERNINFRAGQQGVAEHREFSWGRVAVWPLLYLELPHLLGQS